MTVSDLHARRSISSLALHPPASAPALTKTNNARRLGGLLRIAQPCSILQRQP